MNYNDPFDSNEEQSEINNGIEKYPSNDSEQNNQQSYIYDSEQDPQQSYIYDSEQNNQQPQIYGAKPVEPHRYEDTSLQINSVEQSLNMQEQSTNSQEQLPQVYGANIDRIESPNGGDKFKKPPKKNNLAVYAIAIIISLAVSILGSSLIPNVGSEKVVIYQAIDTSETDASQTTFVQVAEAVKDTVVEITTEKVVTNFFNQYVVQGAGSGVIFTTDGYILTNHHVIDSASNVQVTLSDGTIYNATIIGSDTELDIAVLKIEATGLNPAVFGNSDTVLVGEEVVAIGNPLGKLGGSVTNGIISALNRQILVDGVEMNLLQTNTAINPGNSGGGLFNMKGELIGVVNAKTTGDDVDNIAFAIPSNDALEKIEYLIENGNGTGSPALGVTVVEIDTTEKAIQYGVQSIGVYVSSTTRSEFQEGDLILSIDDNEILDKDDLSDVLSDKKIGDEVKVSVLRNRRIVEFSLKLIELVS